MEVREGYKQTEVGVIPDDWIVKKLRDCIERKPDYGINAPAVAYSHSLPTYIRITDISDDGQFKNDDIVSINNSLSYKYYLQKNDLVFARTGASVGKTYLYNQHDGRLVFAGFLIRCKPNVEILNALYLKFFTQSNTYWKWVSVNSMRSGQPGINSGEYSQLPIPLPPTKAEQTAVATALSDADALIQSLEKLIAKKRLIKQGAMQELLRPKKDWVVKTLEESTNCLDNFRIPLNESQRASMKGDIPYCGANGILDYINDYCIDDDIILIAEDGGYFDEYEHRPIAYEISGKCWVNNHAHILKAKEDMSQNFIFYSLVHKNILRFLASGTRAKLNKSELYKIEIDVPPTIEDQTYIATILSEMDSEISTLENKLAKYRMIKQGMMQELLTGSIRLL